MGSTGTDVLALHLFCSDEVPQSFRGKLRQEGFAEEFGALKAIGISWNRIKISHKL